MATTNLAERIVVDGHLRLGINGLQIPAETAAVKSLAQLASFSNVAVVQMLDTCTNHHLSLNRRVAKVSRSSAACDWTTGIKRSHSNSIQLTDE